MLLKFRINKKRKERQWKSIIIIFSAIFLSKASKSHPLLLKSVNNEICYFFMCTQMNFFWLKTKQKWRDQKKKKLLICIINLILSRSQIALCSLLFYYYWNAGFFFCSIFSLFLFQIESDLVWKGLVGEFWWHVLILDGFFVWIVECVEHERIELKILC